jgi:hypothetical protein
LVPVSPGRSLNSATPHRFGPQRQLRCLLW